MLKNPNRRNGHNPIIHRNVLVPSTQDCVALAFAVEERFCKVLNTWLSNRHETLVPPVELTADMVLWRTLRVRHNQRDFRNTADEYAATKRIAEWVQRVNCELTGHEYVPLEWGE